MMISRVEIENFRSIVRTSFELTCVNLFFGPNRAGKSSVRSAIEYALTLRNEWTDGRGTGIKSQVNHAAKTGRIRLQVGKYDEERRVPPESGAEQKVAALYGALGLKGTVKAAEARMQAILRACGLLELPDSEQKSIFCGALSLDITADSYRGLVNALDPRWPDLGDWFDLETSARRWACRVVELEPFARFSREQRLADKKLAEEIQRRVTDLETKTRRDPSGSPQKSAEANAERDDVVSQLAALDAAEGPAFDSFLARHQAWRERHAVHAEAVRKAADQRARAQNGLAAAETALSTARNKLAGFIAPTRPEQEIDRERNEVAAEAQRLQVEADRLAAEGSAAIDTSVPEACPPGTCFAQQVAAQRQALAKKQREAAEKSAEARVKSARRDHLQRELEDAYKYGSASAYVPVAEKNVAEKQAALEAAVADEAAALAAPGPGDEPQPPARDDARRQRLQQRLDQLTGEAELAQALSHQAQIVEHQLRELDEERLRLAEVLEDVDRWDLLVKAFEPSKDPASIPTRLLNEAIGELAAEVDVSCRDYFGFGVHFEEPWGIFIRLPSGLVPQKQGSGSERLLLSTVLQVALARRAGVPIIMLDEVQRIDTLMRKPFLEYLQAQNDVQSLLFMAAQTRVSATEFQIPPSSSDPELAYFWCDSGTITRT